MGSGRSSRLERKTAIAILGAVALTASQSARGADITWTNPAGGSFSNGGNWLGGSPPGTSDNADFELPGSTAYTVTFNASTQTAGLNVNGSPLVLNLGGNQYTVMQSGGSPFTTVTDINTPLSMNNGTLDTAQTTLVDTGALVSVNGATWTTSIATAQDGAEIDVSGGGTLTTQDQMAVRGATIKVAGVGSSWNYLGTNSALNMGTNNSLSALLQISGGGVAGLQGLDVGLLPGDNATIGLSDVVGAVRSTVTALGGAIGYEGDGHLTVSNGALFSAANNLYLGNTNGSAGTATVGGAEGGFNAELDVTGTMFLGSNEIGFDPGTYSGTLTLNTGSSVTLGALVMGNDSGGGSSVVGTGSLALNDGTLTTKSLRLSTGSITISGGTLSSTGNETIGAGGSNVVVNQTGGLNTAQTHTMTITQGFGNTHSTYNLSGGTLQTTISNSDQFNYSGGNLVGRVTNNSTGVFTVTGGGSLTITGAVTNAGTFHVTNSTFAVTGIFTNSGTFISDPAVNDFTTLNIGSGGILQASAGDQFSISGNLISSSSQSSLWNTAAAELHFVAGTANPHILYLTGTDMGPTSAGYANNFAWGTLALDTSQMLALASGNSGHDALYIGTLLLPDGLSDISDIHGGGLNIYYDPTLAGNAYLAHNSYALVGGGELIPVPEPGTLAVTSLAAVVLLRRRRPQSVAKA